MTILSLVYGKILVIFGLVFPMAQVIAKEVPTDYFQFFYIFLFAGCLAFYLFVHLDTMITRCRLKWESRKNGQRKEEDTLDENYKVPRPINCYGSFYLRIGQVCKRFFRNS